MSEAFLFIFGPSKLHQRACFLRVIIRFDSAEFFFSAFTKTEEEGEEKKSRKKCPDLYICFLISTQTNGHTASWRASKKAIQPLETMASLRGCYLGNLSGGEARSEEAGYRDEGERGRRDAGIRRH